MRRMTWRAQAMGLADVAHHVRRRHFTQSRGFKMCANYVAVVGDIWQAPPP